MQSNGSLPQVKSSGLIEHHLCARNILLLHIEQWPTQLICNLPGGMSNLPCEAMAHSHKFIAACASQHDQYHKEQQLLFQKLEACLGFWQASFQWQSLICCAATGRETSVHGA